MTRPTFLRLELGDAGPVGVFELTVRGEGPPLVLQLDPLLVLDGGTASEAASAARPTITRIVDENGNDLGPDGPVQLGERRGRFEVSVAMPTDCAVTMTARVSVDEAAS